MLLRMAHKRQGHLLSKFWSYLDLEVAAAENQDMGFILQMDGNMWAGSDLIPGDPNKQNNNGKLFQNFLQRNPHVTCVNSLQLCDGIITRMRKTKKQAGACCIGHFCGL